MANEPSPLKIAIPVLGGVYAICGGLAYFTTSGALRSHTPRQVIPVLFSTVAYFCLYGVYVFRQGMTKQLYAAHCKKEGKDISEYSDTIKNADRTVGNCHEQMGPFLVNRFLYLGSLWMYGAFVNPARAGGIGLAYLGFLLIYPIVFGTERIIVSTLPRYYMCYYMMACTVVAGLRTIKYI